MSQNFSKTDKLFHEAWLGMVQPSEGLVVSIPVLVDAQCMQRHGPELQQTFLALCGERDESAITVSSLARLLADLCALEAHHFDSGEALPEALSLYVPEGKQRIAPTMALKGRAPTQDEVDAESTPASRAGRDYELLIWDLPAGLALDKSETVTGPWDYPPAAKFDRLLRQCRVPIGLLHNGEALRLVYAPHGESSGSITFRYKDMATVAGRPILDALVMLLHGRRIFGAQDGSKLRDLLRESRRRQANVTNELAEQVFDALRLLLDGFEAAAERDGSALLREALERESSLAEDNHVYAGLLTVLLRLVFILYAEDRSLLPIDHEHYARHMSLLALFEELQEDAGAYPDSMHQRFGAWGRLLSLFRAIFFGVQHGTLHMPARYGDLFDPARFPFLEGWSSEGAAPYGVDAQAEVRPPSIDDGTLYEMLKKLLILEGQRLSYQTLDVEQIGSVYEALMGYRVERVSSRAACLRPSKVWLSVDDVKTHVSGARGAKWLQEATGLAKSAAEKLAKELSEAAKKGEEAMLALLQGAALKGVNTVQAGKLVLQPGEERRRTSSHYTPRSLSAPIVKKTLDPLLRAMGEAPASERILRLVVCDPAMGSGAFLVEACRYLADQLVAAWTRENVLTKIADAHEDVVNHARRLVAQRCLYGVDKNPYAVSLAKLSLWLVTLAKNDPFTFVDHALRHGDSLVGLSFAQITAFHWEPKQQVETCERELREVLDEAVRARQQILALADDASPEAQREKQRLLDDANDALERVRLIGDLVVGAFFAADSKKERELERNKRLKAVTAWLAEGGEPTAELLAWRAQIRERIPVFHWMVELPEVFWADRPDPLAGDEVNHAAFVDAFVGNPPFAGKNGVSIANGPEYLEWLMTKHPEVKGHPNTDLCAYFFRRAFELFGKHGACGFIGTNTIAQGDTRVMSLKAICDQGGVIFDAQTSFPWPGEAAVTAAIVHFATPSVAGLAAVHLDGKPVASINSRLSAGAERPALTSLRTNQGRAFMGGKLVGIGLARSRDEAAAWVTRNAENARVLREYLGGEDVNTSPLGESDRYMIDFTKWSLDEAREKWPELLEVVEREVKPARMTDKRGTYKTYWWRPGESGGALYAALEGLERCLVCANVSKHLGFSFQSTTPFFANTLYVFALNRYTPFAVLQSRVHERWARLLASSLEDRLRYTASDCFENFPFPQPDPHTVIPALETIGERLYQTRAQYMIDTNQGLTKTYNALKDPACEDPRILALRRLHVEMDAAVLAAYGWSHIRVPPFCVATEEDKQALAHFEQQVLDRLFALNADRAAEEARAAPAPAAKSKKKGAAKKADESQGRTGSKQLRLDED